MLPILIFIISFPSIIFAKAETYRFQKLKLAKNMIGPESTAFDAEGAGPYTSISDGRIVRYEKRTSSFEEFSFTKPNRSKEECDGKNVYGELGAKCGRPAGIEFYHSKKELFIADAFLGLLKVGQHGGLATQLAASAEGKPLKFPNGLSVDQSTGDIYFTDYSSIYSLSQVREAIKANDSTGRFLKYDYNTGKVTVLLKSLSGANGVAIGGNGTFVLVAESIGQRIIKYWLKGDKAFTNQTVTKFEGRPDNIKITPFGERFWVAVNYNKPDEPSTRPSEAIEIDENGNILRIIKVEPYYNTTMITEFYHNRGIEYFVCSLLADYVGVLTKY